MNPFPTIGFISNWPVYQGTSMDHYAHSLIQGINAAARENQCSLLLGCGFSITGKSPQHHSIWSVPGEGIDFVPVGPWNTDGLIIVPDELTETQLHYVRDLLDSGFPVIFTTPEGPGPLVSVDNTAGIQSAFTHLLSHERRRIAFIAGNPGRGGDSEERLRAYQAALTKAGMEFIPGLCAYGEHRKEGGAAAMRQILASGERFDALIASNDLSCIGAMEVLAQAGMRVPEDVAVVGFDDIVEARAVSPSLTTVRHPTFLLGYQAVVTLLEYIRGQQAGSTKVVVPTRLIVRESCGCRPGTLEIQTARLTLDAIVHQMADASFAEAHNSPIEEFQRWSAGLVDNFLLSCARREPTAWLDAVDQAVKWAEAHDENTAVWQAASAILLQNLKNLAQLHPDLDLSYAALYLDQARQEIARQLQQATTRSMVGYMQMISQLGRLTAEMLSAMSIEQTADILARHLPELGINNALVTLYEGGSDDPPAQGKVLFGAGFAANFGGLCFNPRAFPVANLYPTTHPFQLTILPLYIEENLSGFVAFDAPNPELCAALVHNLSAALRISLLYQDALDGRKLAEEANQLKSRFLSMVSHELRTPLSIIVGLSEMSLKGKAVELQDLAQINNSAQHLARLIDDVLDLASSEAGQLRILREPVDLIEVLRIAVNLGEKMAQEKGLAWSAVLPNSPIWVLGDQTRLRQITLNLISNAVKFTQSGEIRLSVAASVGEVSVSVSDTGPGILPADQEKVFNEFYRTERIIESGIGGMGLGLTITKQLVEAHNGRVAIQSPGELGSGSTFTFTLPRLTSRAIQPGEIGPAAEKSSWTVAILGGQGDSTDALAGFLRENGFAVTAWNIDAQADWLARVADSLPDAIFLGQDLAARNGWPVAEILRRQALLENTPVFAFSPDPVGNRGEFVEMNYLQKPIQADVLTKELARLLGKETHPQTVLIVDDDPAILSMHSRLVEKTGKRVVTARNGREALEKVAAGLPDLILLDLNMPEMDGFAVLDALHANPAAHDIPVVILTARVLSDADIERCNRGVTSILSKGIFTAAETLEHLDAALTRKSSLSRSMRRLVRRAIAIIQAHYAEEITRENIATRLNISADYLTDCFRQEFGITPIAYIRRYRIKQACELLLNSDMTITQVAMNVGFSDNAHFTHTFIREMGLSPRAYRCKGKP